MEQIQRRQSEQQTDQQIDQKMQRGDALCTRQALLPLVFQPRMQLCKLIGCCRSCSLCRLFVFIHRLCSSSIRMAVSLYEVLMSQKQSF